jgi:hypothetical protein
MNNKLFRLLSAGLALFFAVVIINSCKKERPDTDTQSSVDNSICEGEFSRLLPQTNNIAVGDSGVLKTGIPVPSSNCPDYWIDTADIKNGFPITMWMFYGSDNDGDSIYETGCTGNDGKIRQGIVKAVFDGHWNQPGTTVTMYLKNYFVNGIHFEGTVAVTRSVNSFAQTVSGGKCSKGSDWSILWNSSRTITINMGDSLNPFDDVCQVTGSASGTDRNSKAFSVDIDPSNPLTREMGCRWITKGMQTIKIDGKKDRTINYGDGTCDNIAKLIIDGNEFEFKLE